MFRSMLLVALAIPSALLSSAPASANDNLVIPGQNGPIHINPERLLDPNTNIPQPGTLQSFSQYVPGVGYVSGVTYIDQYGIRRYNAQYQGGSGGGGTIVYQAQVSQSTPTPGQASSQGVVVRNAPITGQASQNRGGLGGMMNQTSPLQFGSRNQMRQFKPTTRQWNRPFLQRRSTVTRPNPFRARPFPRTR